jgi:serine/threonine-protein kinase
LPGLDVRLQADLAHRYIIERELGRGGMATVYLAHDLKHGRHVALKVLRPELAAALGPERFLREIQLTARLQHPHVLPLFDSGEAVGQLWYVMPYVEGESLRQRLMREKQLPVDDALRIARDVGSALDYAHDHGTVHRDVKPENILLERGEAVVADFGIAHAVSAAGGGRLTETGLVLGTPAYMSPEQAMGDEVDARSDVYSLGCVLYEMLTGEPPYTGLSPQAIIAKRFGEPVPHVRTLRENVPAAVEAAVTKAMAKLALDRFVTARAFVDAFTVPSRPTVAHSPPRGWRAPRARAAAIGLLLLITLAFVWVGRHAWFASPAGTTRIQSLAVLPLDNLSGDAQQDYFADGMTDALIGDLSTISTLRVISRRSVMQYKSVHKPLAEIAKALRVDAIVEGTVVRAGDQVRITAQLLDASTDRHLWAGSYQRNLGDVLALQNGVARLIADEVARKLAPRARSHFAADRAVDPKAHDDYLMGRYFWNARTDEGFGKAIGYFQRAVERDSTYARAYAAIAAYYNALPFYARIAPAEAFPKAKAAALLALAIDDSLPEAHGALAFVLAYYEWDWTAAEREFQRALALNPSDAAVHHSYSRYLASTGRGDEAMTELRHAQELDPLSLALKANEGMVLYFGGKYDEAIARLRTTLELDSTHAVAHWGLGMALEQKRMYAEAAVEIRKAMEAGGTDPLFIASLGHVYAAQGKRQEVRRLLDQLDEESKRSYVSPYHAAVLHAGLGEKDKAFEDLDRAARERSTMLVYLKKDPRLEPLRSDPRFQELLRRVHFPG